MAGRPVPSGLFAGRDGTGLVFWKLCPVKSSRFLFFLQNFQWKVARATLVYLTNFREDFKGGKFQIVKMTWKNAQNFIISRDKNGTDRWILTFTGPDGPDDLWWKTTKSRRTRDGTEHRPSILSRAQPWLMVVEKFILKTKNDLLKTNNELLKNNNNSLISKLSIYSFTLTDNLFRAPFL